MEVRSKGQVSSVQGQGASVKFQVSSITRQEASIKYFIS